MGSNLDPDTFNPKNINDDSSTCDNSIPGELNKPNAQESSVFFGKKHQHQYDPKRYPDKWQEFCDWCYKVDPAKYKPTYEGFQTWMAKQTPYWRNHTKAVLEDFTYTLDGKSYTSAQASRMMLADPNIFQRFKRVPATKQ